MSAMPPGYCRLKMHLAERIMGWNLQTREVPGGKLNYYWCIGDESEYHVDDWYPLSAMEHAMEVANCLSITHRVEIQIATNHVTCHVSDFDGDQVNSAAGAFMIGAEVICTAIAQATGWAS